MNENENTDIHLVYDRECPACEFYCQRVDVSPAAGKLIRVNAREHSPHMDEITSANLDIDAGMVLMKDGTIYYGSDAIHQLALLSSKTGLVNRLAHALFRHPRIAKLLYPVLAACRNLLLKALRRTRINNLDLTDNERF